MALDIWFREDLRNAILAADSAVQATAAMVEGEGFPEEAKRALLYYRQGYRAALETLAMNFGLIKQYNQAQIKGRTDDGNA